MNKTEERLANAEELLQLAKELNQYLDARCAELGLSPLVTEALVLALYARASLMERCSLLPGGIK